MSVEFLITTLVVVAIPGTGALYTIAAGLARGTRASVVAAVACTLGIVPHMVAALTGLAAILYASSVAFQVVKYLGVAYLLYMAYRTWRDRSDLVAGSRRPTSVSPPGSRSPSADARGGYACTTQKALPSGSWSTT